MTTLVQLDKKKLQMEYEVEYAPGFCAMQFLFDFSCWEDKYKDPDDGYWGWSNDLGKFRSATQAAIAVVSDAMGTSKLMLCDKVNGEMYKHLIIPLSKRKTFTKYGKKYSITLGKPFINVSHNSKVIEMVIQRVVPLRKPKASSSRAKNRGRRT